jgi:hypothetical protein
LLATNALLNQMVSSKIFLNLIKDILPEYIS